MEAAEKIQMRNAQDFVKRILLFLLFTFIFLRYLYPAHYGRDTDIFWHVKTGEVIVQEQHIPSSDSFTYPPKEPVRERFLLQSYWLADVLLFLFYKLWGVTGLVVLRSLILCMTVLFVYLRIRKSGYLIPIVLSLLLGVTLMPSSAIRPNLFSFLFTAAMIFCLDRYRDEMKKRYQISLFIVMLLWSNMHGGYIIGAGILTIYIITEIIILVLISNGENAKKTLLICLTAGAGIIATFLNPLGIKSHLFIIRQFTDPAFKSLTSDIETETGLIKSVMQYPNEMIFLSLIIVGFILASTAINITRKRAAMSEVAIVLALLFITVYSVRAMPIFIISGLMLGVGKGDYHIVPRKRSRKVDMIALVFIGITLCLFIWKDFPRENPGKLKETDVIYPRLGSFLSGNHIQGNMLNREYTGNFLILKLFPQYKVFTDSRYINLDVFFDGLDMFYAIKEPALQKDIQYTRSLIETCVQGLAGQNKIDYTNEYWYRLLGEYQIDFIVGRVSHPRSGQLFPLFLKLIDDNTWKLIYMDGNAVVMIKDNHKNDDIIGKYPPKNKHLIYEEAILENIEKDSASAYETLAYAFLMKGDTQKAEFFANNALAFNKTSKIANLCIQYINTSKRETPQ
jgi:hypothetical protein